ncbi:unnamed protein product [Mytilus coruscus]|uniref:Uncharacterized protein n=1 Tax=Mytilus coruscus TaxID=42192 RepID=A0A6J8BA45_MYTCO|nr:unnamed protein product [Mytilus coruscus]
MESSPKPTRKRRRSNSEDDPLWTNRPDGDYYSASSDKQKKLTALSRYIPRETKLPPLDADLIKIMDYLNANLTFDTSVKKLEQENQVKVREYLIENFLPKRDADSDKELMKTVGSSSRVSIIDIEAGRRAFQKDLKEILYDLLLTTTVKKVEEIRFTTMLEKFCRMCNLNGSVGLVKATMIKDVRVVAVPDLTFKISSNEMPDRIQIMAVAEVLVKVSTNEIHATRQNPEAFDKETLQTMDPSKIIGFSQHVGQLIIGLDNSCFKKECLGLLLHETKVIMVMLLYNCFTQFLNDHHFKSS